MGTDRITARANSAGVKCPSYSSYFQACLLTSLAPGLLNVNKKSCLGKAVGVIGSTKGRL